MKDSRIREIRSRIRTLLIFYVPCIVVLAILCLLIYGTSNYYAAAYPYANISSLPRNSTTVLLSIFNGYTEKVPLMGNQSTIVQSISSIRQDAEQSAGSTISELVLAFITLMLFSFLSLILDWKSKLGTPADRKRHLLPAIFLFALVASQYVTFSADLLRHVTPSGISLFFVDSLLIVVWYGTADELLLVRISKRAASLPHADNPILLGPGQMKFIKALTMILPIALILFTLTLLQNLGLFAYNQSFMATYFAHFSGLVEFVVMFAVLFYYQEILSLISKTRGSGSRPRRAS